MCLFLERIWRDIHVGWQGLKDFHYQEILTNIDWNPKQEKLKWYGGVAKTEGEPKLPRRKTYKLFGCINCRILVFHAATLHPKRNTHNRNDHNNNFFSFCVTKKNVGAPFDPNQCVKSTWTAVRETPEIVFLSDWNNNPCVRLWF